MLLLGLAATGLPPAAAQPAPPTPHAGTATAASAAALPTPEISQLEASRVEDGLLLGFAVNFELPRSVEDALHKGVPLYFVAEAELLRDRWYWRDKRVARAERTWRLAFQPLSRRYRVSFGGLNQNFDSLPDALAAIRRLPNWRIADAGTLEGTGHYVEFSYRLDTNLMPRPLQIGLGGQAEWTLRLEKTLRID
ncbi:DUF4390 domain-containing protein [Piscinibacter sakaiensis]|uniref:Putative proline rich signal peptide protein n=1 Tax=Piscinibacter sakaiensis TaxID=1547922 RepID=A0A0K8NYH0_PISS1|nr:DUF4390 domain-containing protein [Piscinibacter sakaiensis]GAP35418.1 putative proline rich signal peptide protein [Piscinibacter sakaiensis]